MMIIFISLHLALGRLKEEILLSHKDCKENHKHFSGDTLAYVTPWNSLGYMYSLKYPEKFNFISPVWHEVSFYYSAGEFEFSISGEADTDYLSQARGLFSIVPRLIITRTHPRAYIALLENDHFISKFTRGLESFTKEHSYQGLVLEFWLQGLSIVSPFEDAAQLRALQLRMITKISKALRKMGLKLIITVPPTKNEINSYEFLELIENFDKVNVMTYDYSRNGPGPNAPLPWIQETLQRLIKDKDVDYRKILLGIPFYGYDYNNGRANAVVAEEFLDIIRGDVEDVWEENGKEHKFLYTKNGKECVLYYPTLSMLEERISFAASNEMGVAIWELGQGLEYFYNLF